MRSLRSLPGLRKPHRRRSEKERVRMRVGEGGEEPKAAVRESEVGRTSACVYVCMCV